MKKKYKKNGFAMVEILIAAVTVIGVFSLLYNSVYPLIGAYSASDKYDDLDSKYVAFYIKEMLETDGRFSIINNVLLNSSACSNTCHIYNTYPYKTNPDGSETPLTWGADIKTITDHHLYKNELCNMLREDSNQKNNQFFCNKYITGARVNRIIVTDYKLANFKNAIKNSTNSSITRSLKNYVNYMPTHIHANKTGYRRVIVEIEHDSYNSVGDIYYTYAEIEVKG